MWAEDLALSIDSIVWMADTLFENSIDLIPWLNSKYDYMAAIEANLMVGASGTNLFISC